MSYERLQAQRFKAVTPSDTDNISYYDTSDNRGNVLYVGTGGDVKVLGVGGDEVTFSNVADGSFLPIHVLRVFDTGTTASDIIALW